MALIFWGRILMPSTTAHCLKEALVLMELTPKRILQRISYRKWTEWNTIKYNECRRYYKHFTKYV